MAVESGVGEIMFCNSMLMIKKKLTFVCFIIMTAMLMTACKLIPEDVIGDISTNTLIMNEDGSVREICCDDFSGVSFDYSGLKNKIKSDVADYCQSYGEDSIKLLKYKEDDGIIKVALDYKSLDDYNKFNGTSYRLDDASEISKQMKLKDNQGNDITAGDIILDGYKVICIDGKLSLIINGEIMYYNSHVTSIDGKDKALLDGEGYGVIIYK